MKAITPKVLLKDLRELIAMARQDVARQVNSSLVLLYWRIGKRIRQDVLKEKRAEYGEQIVYAVSTQLVKEFGTGFSEKNLRRMVQFAETFPNEQKPGEEAPIGLILCAGKKKETVELLELEKSGIRVASYWTKVLPMELFQKKLHEAIQHARARLAQKEGLRGKRLLPE